MSNLRQQLRAALELERLGLTEDEAAEFVSKHMNGSAPRGNHQRRRPRADFMVGEQVRVVDRNKAPTLAKDEIVTVMGFKPQGRGWNVCVQRASGDRIWFPQSAFKTA